jgi:DNA helicase-2/ATP-dependent DNA helicase PcrA
MSLTGQQKEAVANAGSLVLTACPGSGKTRTIAAKLLQEIETVRDTTRAIACITYTNSAVQEIELRISPELKPGDDRHFTVSTIHSFCLNYILRPFAWRLAGFTGVPRILTRDKPDFEEIVRYACDQINYFNINTRDFDAFESLNLDMTGALIGSALTNDAVRLAAPHFWSRCDELGYIDFSNIIYKSYCLLRDHADIARSLSARFKWLLIDEFQDTTELQIEILKLIHGTGRTMFFAVGDQAQSIYAFTGARPELVEPFAAFVGARTDLSLSGNFRSSTKIVVHAERLFPRAPAMEALGSARDCEVEPRFSLTDDTFNTITDEFLPAIEDLQISLGKATILAKEWGSLIRLSRRLREFGVPVVGPGARPYRRSRLFATLAEQLCGAVIDPQPETTRQLERALFNAIHDVTAYPRFDVFTFDGRVAIVKLLREAKRLSDALGGADWLDAMSEYTGQILLGADFVDTKQAGLFYASVQEMKADMQRQNVDVANLSIEDLGLFASPNKALRLSTIHFAKGREYEAVALIGLRDGSIPDFRATSVSALAGEKRLFYVGVTRACRILHYIAEPDNWGNPPSRFLGAEGVDII